MILSIIRIRYLMYLKLFITTISCWLIYIGKNTSQLPNIIQCIIYGEKIILSIIRICILTNMEVGADKSAYCLVVTTQSTPKDSSKQPFYCRTYVLSSICWSVSNSGRSLFWTVDMKARLAKEGIDKLLFRQVVKWHKKSSFLLGDVKMLPKRIEDFKRRLSSYV